MKRLMEAALPTLLTASLAVGAAGCGESGYQLDPTKPSRVTDLDFEKEHSEDTGVCTFSVKGVCFMYAQELVPDEWTMTIEQCKDGPRRSKLNNDCGDDTLEISRRTYRALDIGSIVVVHGNKVTEVPQ